jgi:hypothetical protein
MTSLIRKYVAISVLLGQGMIYAAVYLAFGRAGAHLVAIALLIGWILWLAVIVEKMAASSRKSRSESRC